MIRKLCYLFLVALGVSCNDPLSDYQNSADDYAIIPQPVTLNKETGRFKLDENTVIIAEANFENEAVYLRDLLNEFSGLQVEFDPAASASSNVIFLVNDEGVKNDEGYRLLVDRQQIKISAKSAKGVFYGIQSLQQLLKFEGDPENQLSGTTIPAVNLEDYPRYTYRGMHLDVARHFFPVSFVKKYIDLIALHKMNTFHWHLTEDQGWRIEIKALPELTKVGAYRNGTVVGTRPWAENDNTKHGGFYTQEEIKDVVAYAASRHITVIPEIELPGHSSAAIAAYPNLSCFPEEPSLTYGGVFSQQSQIQQAEGHPKVVQEVWGVMDDVYCGGKEETFTFLETVLDEVVELFPSEYIHIGGDECPKGNWKRCPLCQQRMKEEGLADEHELQSYFVQRIEKYLNTKGKKIIGWDEILEGGLAPNATVMSWRGMEGGITAANQDHDVIMTPTSHCYFDYHQEEGLSGVKNIGGLLTAEKVYGLQPTPDALEQDKDAYILGAQGNVWTEYMTEESYVEYMVLPRMSALSEVVWSKEADRDYQNFTERLPDFFELLKRKGYNYADYPVRSEDVATDAAQTEAE
ncbi:beta-N-acetylhexosaminidase [Robertkochia solimangrovi]|uniref:beta-N-acetylhexosaminidase n=1 Tax=Robertkochia solimangrovi TaxID=2213046 RepID=UPI00117CAABA|nr:beta-N-acetylhexosaminidase [Robertkochia solimangrovi]TRZ41568.1 beta-N-acetylglucosaminidase [Robertkochia solimangrovi]